MKATDRYPARVNPDMGIQLDPELLICRSVYDAAMQRLDELEAAQEEWPNERHYLESEVAQLEQQVADIELVTA